MTELSLFKYCGVHGRIYGNDVAIYADGQKRCKICKHKKQSLQRTFCSDHYLASLLLMPIDEARRSGLLEVKKASIKLKRLIDDKKHR